MPAAPALKMPLPPEEMREFEADEDGQLRLY
jgi:hypothetical protein